jgi:hypothetical protein
MRAVPNRSRGVYAAGEPGSGPPPAPRSDALALAGNPLGCPPRLQGAEVSWREHGAVPAITSAGRAEDARW